jgi:hypothetical protein
MQEDLDKERKVIMKQVGQARRADHARDGRDGGYVWRFTGNCGEVVAGN